MKNNQTKSGFHILGKWGLSGLMELALNIGVTLGVLITVTLPWSLSYISDHYYGYTVHSNFYQFILVFLILNGTLMSYILVRIRNIFSTINHNNPFAPQNVTSLRHISWVCFFIALLYTAKAFLYFTIFTVILAMLFFIAWAFMLVLSEVFKQAVETKQENDLTI